MGNVVNAVTRIAEIFRKRSVAAVLLATVCLVSAVAIAANVTSVNIVDGGEQKTVITMRRDTKSILNQAGIALAHDDEVIVGTENDEYTEITILRAFDVNITADGETKTVQMVGGTVANALEEAEIALPDEDDIISAALDEELVEGMVISLDRVEYVVTTETKSIPYETEKVNDSSLAKGKTKVSVKGVNGTKEIVYTSKYVNGEKVNSTVTSEKVTKKAINEKILVGTYVAPKKSSSVTSSNKGGVVLDANGVPVNYKKVLTGSGTAYTAPKGARTSTGKIAKKGLVAVNPKVIPYGTEMYIVSADGKFVYGYAVAADTGSALRSNRVLVDLYYNTEAQCISFGRRQVKIYIL